MARTTPLTARRVGALLATTALILGAALVPSSPAAAGGCILGMCGGVQNNTNTYMMEYTRALNSEGHTDWCDVWNSEGDNRWSWAHWRCGQRSLGPKEARGGFGSDVDVDAFTFNADSYTVAFDGGGEQTLDRGVWTKIANDQTANCQETAGSGLSCYIAIAVG